MENKKLFSVYRYEKTATGPTGPWVFLFYATFRNEEDAFKFLEMRYGSQQTFQVFEAMGAL